MRPYLEAGLLLSTRHCFERAMRRLVLQTLTVVHRLSTMGLNLIQTHVASATWILIHQKTTWTFRSRPFLICQCLLLFHNHNRNLNRIRSLR